MVQHGQSKMYKARYHENDILPFGTTWTGTLSSKLMDTMWTVKVALAFYLKRPSKLMDATWIVKVVQN